MEENRKRKGDKGKEVGFRLRKGEEEADEDDEVVMRRVKHGKEEEVERNKREKEKRE